MNPLTTHHSLLALLLTLLLAGCASIDKAKATWQGAPYDEVISRWGAPYRSTKLADGSPVHTWVAEGGYSGGPATSVGIFGGSGGGGVGVGTSFIFGGGGGEPQRCERTLVFRNGRVVDQTWLGDPTFCSQFQKE
ncbi:MAG: hypothetical protein ACRET6_11460 [Burkholderiales bacterium]